MLRTISLTSLCLAVFFSLGIAAHAQAAADPIKVLIVPGHEPEYGGAEYKNLKERDMNLALAKYLKGYLATDPRFSVVTARDDNGWNPELASYFNKQWEAIKDWVSEHKAAGKAKLADGEIAIDEDPVAHQVVKDDVGTRIYGISKWANETGVDVAVNIHFNDYGSRRFWEVGEYSGYAVYVPDSQYLNGKASAVVGDAVSDRLKWLVAQSDTPREQGGVVEDQDLIALGAFDTENYSSILVEYGYIYESQFQVPSIRDAILREYAYQTFLGLKDAFEGKESTQDMHSTTLLPHNWQSTMRHNLLRSTDILSLQAAMAIERVYPPKGMTKNECPVSGLFGGCTRAALAQFQKRHGIDGDGTVAGAQTLQALNDFYGI